MKFSTVTGCRFRQPVTITMAYGPSTRRTTYIFGVKNPSKSFPQSSAEPRNHGKGETRKEGTLARLEAVGVSGVQAEAGAAVLEMKAHAVDDDAAADRVVATADIGQGLLVDPDTRDLHAAWPSGVAGSSRCRCILHARPVEAPRSAVHGISQE